MELGPLNDAETLIPKRSPYISSDPLVLRSDSTALVCGHEPFSLN